MTDNQLEIVREIDRIYCQLSPENLTCDGELPQSVVKSKRAKLLVRLKKCFDCLGREVDIAEVWDLLERG